MKYYLSLGMKFLKIHRILHFQQKNGSKFLLTLILRKDKKVMKNLIKGCTTFLIIVFMVKVLKMLEKINVKLLDDKKNI